MKLWKFMPKLIKELRLQLELNDWEDQQIEDIVDIVHDSELVVLRKLLDEEL